MFTPLPEVDSASLVVSVAHLKLPDWIDHSRIGVDLDVLERLCRIGRIRRLVIETVPGIVSEWNSGVELEGLSAKQLDKVFGGAQLPDPPKIVGPSVLGIALAMGVLEETILKNSDLRSVESWAGALDSELRGFLGAMSFRAFRFLRAVPFACIAVTRELIRALELP